MSEIYSKIIRLVGKNNDVYTRRWLITKLQISGKPNVVCFKNMIEFIAND